jgi:uncharacterized protein YdhG (YjbR/CyaY superfamily)
MKEQAPVQERILTPEEEVMVKQLSKAQAQLRESLEELQNAIDLPEERAKKIQYHVADAIAVILAIAGYAGMKVITGGGYFGGGPGLIEGGLNQLMATGALAGVIAPIIAASYTIESLIRRRNPLKDIDAQEDIDELRGQFDAQMQEYEEQVALSRGIVNNALVRGGATLKHNGIHDATLTVTPEQIEMARQEAERDGVVIVRPEDVK